MLEGGTLIPEGSNLDDYKTPGNYYCSPSLIVPTIQNIPPASNFAGIAFTLKVEMGAGTINPIQTYREYRNRNIATRVWISGSWTEWSYQSNDATFLSYHSSTTASDFNEMRSIGAYWINPSTTAENHPSNTFGILEVMGGMQRFTEYDNQRRIFVRIYANSQWTSWVSFDHS